MSATPEIKAGSRLKVYTRNSWVECEVVEIDEAICELRPLNSPDQSGASKTEQFFLSIPLAQHLARLPIQKETTHGRRILSGGAS